MIVKNKVVKRPTETFNLAFLGATSKFKDMPQGYQPQSYSQGNDAQGYDSHQSQAYQQ